MGVALAATAVSAQQGSGQGQGQRQGQGQGGGRGGNVGSRDHCGSSLAVVMPDGGEHSFKPAADFLKGMPVKEIDQGETPRPAARLADVLQRAKAGWVKVVDCADISQDLPSGLPVEGDLYVVVTGRGSLKVVREVRPGRYANVAQNIKRLRFHGAGKGRAEHGAGK